MVRVNFFIFYFYIWREREGVEEKRRLKSLGFGHQTVKPIPSSWYTIECTSFRTWKVLGNVNGCYWFKGEIIVYSRSTINAYSLISHEWWVPLIKFIVEPTIHVRGESIHL